MGGGEGAASDPRSEYNLHHSYLGRSRYAEQLIRWYKHFDRNRVLILTTEDLEDDVQGMLDRVFGFLGLKPFEADDSVMLNLGSYQPMRRDTRRILVDYFRPHNERLSNLLSRGFDWDR